MEPLGLGVEASLDVTQQCVCYSKDRLSNPPNRTCASGVSPGCEFVAGLGDSRPQRGTGRGKNGGASHALPGGDGCNMIASNGNGASIINPHSQ
jgi:hypothetical protein